MRASRLLSIQMLLQARGRMSAPALAAELEVSLRTLYRDIDELSAAGVPVYAERGRSGGFQLREGWQTSLTGLTPSEARAVFLAGLAGPAAQLGLGRDVETAKLKLLSSLPTSWRDESQTISARLHLDPIDWYREADAVPCLGIVANAVWAEQPVSIRYDSWQGEGTRLVHPLGLVLKAGVWYLVAALRGEPRTFRVSNVLAAEVVPGHAPHPKRFDLAGYWQASTRRFERELYTQEAILLATPAGLKGLAASSSAVAKAVARAKPSRRKDGRTRVRVPIESIEHAVGPLLRLAPEVEVLGPASLRQALVRRLGRIAQLYGGREQRRGARDLVSAAPGPGSRREAPCTRRRGRAGARPRPRRPAR